ncbi:hypothetical protein E0H22_23930 [Rhodopseudomonas boonkerdii]|uniref:hypothetical protein n=1 Tax=Rhodopseudomonas boonkerdii TaxID=475937 RepID=UPI001E3974CB|nr:hypothetical protein [Rhodopseudomonas boonkerdii]UGV28442.1 hypothetical protein E0H22_23930 [Rhodopseudomonas boonkerdii]
MITRAEVDRASWYRGVDVFTIGEAALEPCIEVSLIGSDNLAALSKRNSPQGRLLVNVSSGGLLY